MNDFRDLLALESQLRAALVNRDSAGLVLDRLGPAALDALVAWYVDPRGGDRGWRLLDEAPLLDAWLEGLLSTRSLDLPKSSGASGAVAFTCGMAIGVATRGANGQGEFEASEPEDLQGTIARVGRSCLLPDRWSLEARRDALHRLLRVHRDLVRVEGSIAGLLFALCALGARHDRRGHSRSGRKAWTRLAFHAGQVAAGTAIQAGERVDPLDPVRAPIDAKAARALDAASDD
ncbi:MAG: hypothetical protein ACYTFV_01060 [Planctomycetota bacterium]|jgi:hypothetical protein